MEFCSKYGYNYGFEGSDSEEYSDVDENTKKKITRKTRKADTNIIAVKFDKLVASNEMFAGEPKSCKSCSAIMSLLSHNNVVKENGKMIWTCEFCEESNDLTKRVDDMNEIPKKDDVTFMLELPKKKETIEDNSDKNKNVSSDNSYLCFCIDVSGSMDTTIPVNNSEMQMQMQNNFTRLNGVKVACMETLKKLKEDEPEKRVTLTTFSDQVKYYGDCTNISNDQPLLNIGGSSGAFGYYQQQQQKPGRIQKIKNIFTSSKNSNSESEEDNIAQSGNGNQVVSTPKDLDNKERILTFANNLSGNIKGIKETHASIDRRIQFLRTEGSTALGPGLLFSIGFASKKPGSSIILCTDGCANVGLGSIDSMPGENSQKVYDEIADFAKEKGVVVNVISMEGTDCKLALLGRVADRSNGTMSIVNPLNLSEEFKSILGNRIVATNVVAKLIVSHKYLYIRDDKLEAEESQITNEKDKESLEKHKKSVNDRNIGNANIDKMAQKQLEFILKSWSLQQQEKKQKRILLRRKYYTCIMHK